MKQSILKHPMLPKLIGLDAHIMLCLIRQRREDWTDPFLKPSRLRYSIWKKVYPFWGFKKYIKTKKYLLHKGFINSDIYNDKIYYFINYKKLRGLKKLLKSTVSML